MRHTLRSINTHAPTGISSRWWQSHSCLLFDQSCCIPFPTAWGYSWRPSPGWQTRYVQHLPTSMRLATHANDPYAFIMLTWCMLNNLRLETTRQGYTPMHACQRSPARLDSISFLYGLLNADIPRPIHDNSSPCDPNFVFSIRLCVLFHGMWHVYFSGAETWNIPVTMCPVIHEELCMHMLLYLCTNFFLFSPVCAKSKYFHMCMCGHRHTSSPVCLHIHIRHWTCMHACNSVCMCVWERVFLSVYMCIYE